MKLIFFFGLCLVFLPGRLMAQNEAVIKGKVLDEQDDKGVPYVNVSVLGTKKGSSSGPEGAFRIDGVNSYNCTLRVSTVGYKEHSVSLELKPGESRELIIRLQNRAYEHDEVVVTGNMEREQRLSSSVNVQTLDGADLRTGAADPVIEGIEQMNGVSEQVSCGVCGTNGIRINGMATPYTLMMIDGMPFMGSLGAVYGIDGVPSSLLERVEVTKGPSSTLYGPRAIAGAVNVITRSPSEIPRARFKADHNTHGQTNAQLIFRPDLAGDSLNSFLSIDHSRADKRIDENGDGFTDFPLNESVSVFNKWSWTGSKGGSGNVAMRFYKEDRYGGTMEWRPGDEGSDEVYGEAIETRRLEFLASYRPPVEERIRTGISISDHFQNSYYGTEHFKGRQKNGFAYLTWRKTLADHELLAGGNLRYEHYRDNTPASADQERFIPGLFVQDEWMLDSGMALTGGIRADLHNAHGLILTPRLLFKKELNDRSTFRINSGSGFREVDVFTEDHAALTGSREVVIEEELRPERSWNVSANFSRSHHLLGGVGSLDLDLFYTRFDNKIVPDLNSHPEKIVYRNLDGHGVSQGIALSLAHRFHFPLELKLGGTYQQVYQYREEEGELKKQAEVYAPVFTGNFRVKGKIPVLGIRFRWKGKVTGPQRLPEYPAPFERDRWSPWFSLHHVNLRRSIGDNWGVYIGVKNLFDRTQPTPLINPQNPFSPSFDTEYVYGPLQGRRFYFGIDWRIGGKEE